MTLDPAMLAIEGHGAVEVDAADPARPPVKVVLAGPIRFWWSPGQWDTPAHGEFVQWRDAVRVALVQHGCLVYSPHRAWQGSWHEDAQAVNDAAIRAADVIVVLTPAGVPADGTAKEIAVALDANVPVLPYPPGSAEWLGFLLQDVAAIGLAASTKNTEGWARVHLASRVAAKAHFSQLDKTGRPYIGHPARVAARLHLPSQQVVGWLHDVIEDTGLTADDLLRNGFSVDEVDAVVALTRLESDAGDEYYARVKALPLAYAVKKADIADNTDPARTAALTASERERLAAKYRHALAVLDA